MTQTELGLAVGESKAVICDIELGRAGCSAIRAILISRALGISISRLLDDLPVSLPPSALTAAAS